MTLKHFEGAIMRGGVENEIQNGDNNVTRACLQNQANHTITTAIVTIARYVFANFS
jgi:hypothetical protein